MIPILFDEDEKQFNTLGIGMLNDAISCIVTEARNGAYELEMEYPITGERYADIRNSRIIYAVPAKDEEPEPFRIYKISRPFNGVVTVSAEHISYQLSYIPVMPFTANSVSDAFTKLKTFSAEENPFEFWTDKSTAGKFTIDSPVSLRSVLGGSEGSILDLYGGEFEFTKYIVKLHAHRGTDNGVTIAYGKNLTDIKQDESIANTITGICPFWKSEEKLHYLPEKVVHGVYASNYPFERTVTKDFSSLWDDEPTDAQLRAAAEAYITSAGIGVPSVSIDVSFVDLPEVIEKVSLCDTVTVVFEKLGISEKAKVVKTVYNTLRDTYTKVSIGSIAPSFTQTMIDEQADTKNEIANTQSALESAIVNATNRITGVYGGYIVYHYNADGNPYEMLILDEESGGVEENAVNIWRFNSGGLGHSSDGGKTYSTAITQDGSIVADFIKAGKIDGVTINGDCITTGVIQSKDGKYVLDLDTGEVNMASANITGGRINIETASETDDRISLTSVKQILQSFFEYNAKLTSNGLQMTYTKQGSTTPAQESKLWGGTLDVINGGVQEIKITGTDMQFIYKGWITRALFNKNVSVYDVSNGGHGKTGYVGVVSLHLKNSSYMDEPLRFVVCGRKYHFTVWVQFASSSAGLTAISSAKKHGFGAGDIICAAKLDTSSPVSDGTIPFALYVGKSESYDIPSCIEFDTGAYNRGFVKWASQEYNYTATLPSGATVATAL